LADDDYLGYSISLSADGTVVAVGAPGGDGNTATDSGYCKIFFWNTEDQQWEQVGDDIVGTVAGENTGESVALSGDGKMLAIGAARTSGGAYARVFTLDVAVANWILVGGPLVGGGDAQETAYKTAISVSQDGSLVAFGDPLNNASSGAASGRLRIFSRGSSCPEAPSASPLDKSITNAPTTSPDANNARTAKPSLQPAESPAAGAPPTIPERQITFMGISLDFVGVTQLGLNEIETFEDIMESWYEDYYSGDVEVQTIVSFRSQKVTTDESVLTGVVNTLVYDQSLSYTEKDLTITEEELLFQPFHDETHKQKFGDLLRGNINAFQNLQSPLKTPVLSFAPATLNDPGNGGLSTGAIAGIAAGMGFSVLLGVGFFLYRRIYAEEQSIHTVRVQATPLEGQRQSSIPFASAVVLGNESSEPSAPTSDPPVPTSEPSFGPRFKDQMRSADPKEQKRKPQRFDAEKN